MIYPLLLALTFGLRMLGDPAAPPAPTVTMEDSVSALETMLNINGGNPKYARRVALAVHLYSAKHGVNPALVVGVIGVEDSILKPTARNRSGATGIMQVMPHWLRDIKSCGRNLRNIETNICFGTKVLAINLSGRSVRRGLYGYNGCTGRGGRCSPYANKVLARAKQGLAQIPPDIGLTLD